MTNTTAANNRSLNNGFEYIWIYVIWIFYFFVVGMTNLFVAVTVLRYKALRTRKEYVMICGLAFSDGLAISSGYSCEAFYRLILIYKGLWSTKRPVWFCLTMPQNLIYWFAMPASALMLLIVSIDRLICVAAPITYIKLTKRYANRTVLSVGMFSMISAILCVAFGFHHKNDPTPVMVSAACYAGSTVKTGTNRYYSAYFLYIQSISAFLSVILYLCVGVVYFKKKQQTVGDSAGNQSDMQENSRQRRLTKSVAVSCFCTTVFYIIPIMLGYTGEYLDLPRLFLQGIWILPPLNPLCNVIIYIKRQADVRKGMKALLTNKQLPPNLNLWHTVSVARTTTHNK